MIIDTSLAYVDNKFIFKSTKSESGERTLVMPDSIIEILKKHRKDQNIIKLALGEGYQKNDLVYCQDDGAPIIPGSFSHKSTDFLKK